VSAVTTSVAGPTITRRAFRRLVEWLPVIVVFCLGLATWQWLLPDGLNIDKSLLPRFSAVMSSFWTGRGTLWHGGWITFEAALAGFAIGCGLAFLCALVLARWRPLGNALMPYMIAANAVPIIAFAPITNAWFGLLSPWSKITIAAVLCFFPVLVNSVRGLTSVRPESIELMRSYAASEREIFRRVRIPTSLPFVFTALKIASVLAMIGAVVGDYFGGSTEALGVQIPSAVSIGQYETAWAAILVACIMGIAFYASIALLERFVLSWHPSTRGTRE
jgi:NitT/TauT family transport system permease protein